jgi:putative membrane protein
MTLDATLAVVHHLAIFGLAVVLAAEWAIVHPGLVATDIRRLVRVDSMYGVLAGTVLGVGFARVFLGAKPASFYTTSTTFWLKIGAFALVGLLSIRPTLRYLRWRRAINRDPSALPPTSEVTAANRVIVIQMAVFASIPVLAALMARGIGA